MKTCCFCFDLKGGAIASAVVTLIIYVKAVLASIIGLTLISHVTSPWRDTTEHFAPTDRPAHPEALRAHYTVVIVFGVALAVSLLIVSFCVLLLIGIQKGIRGLFFPWITMMGLKIGGCVVFACLIIPVLGSGLYPVLLLVGILILGAFQSYMVWCVCAYYNSVSAATAVPYQPCEVPSHHVQFQEEFPHKPDKDTKLLV